MPEDDHYNLGIKFVTTFSPKFTTAAFCSAISTEISVGQH